MSKQCQVDSWKITDMLKDNNHRRGKKIVFNITKVTVCKIFNVKMPFKRAFCTSVTEVLYKY